MGYYTKYFDYFVNKTLGRVKWGYVVFFVTSVCNAKCKHCFFWESLNHGENELTLEEIEKISKKLGKTQVLLLSGGEPFLRKDLFEVVSLFIKNNGVKVVSSPTNAILKKNVIDVVSKLSERFPDVTFSINPSIDSLYEEHDEFRGVKGNFEKAIDTLKALVKLREERKNVEVVVNTTVSDSNYANIDAIIDFFKQFNITYHNFELLRGEPMEKALGLPSLDEIKDVHRKALSARDEYIKRNTKGMLGLLERVSVLGVTRYTQALKENVLRSKKFPFVCSAGKNIVVIEPHGEVRLCELTKVIGNLRDFNYDMAKVLKNEEAKSMFEFAKGCRCTHICFLNMSVAHDKKSLLKIPFYFLSSLRKSEKLNDAAPILVHSGR